MTKEDSSVRERTSLKRGSSSGVRARRPSLNLALPDSRDAAQRVELRQTAAELRGHLAVRAPPGLPVTGGPGE